MLLLDGISSWLKFKLILYSHSDEWPEICQKGKRQSPIGVCKSNSKSASIPPFEFYYYNNRFKAFVENKGHTVEISIENGGCELPTIKGGNLDGEYILDSIHFHWEAEHTIDGKRYPLEGHYLHYNKKCGDLESALLHPDGLVVLAVMFEVANCFNPRLDNIINTTEVVARKINKPKEIRGGIVVDQLLPKNRSKFFTYEGSKTTPNCNENVRWIIFEELLPIGRDQLKRLTDVDSESGERLEKNYRPIQELNDREVLYSSGTLNMKYVKDYIKEQLGKLRS